MADPVRAGWTPGDALLCLPALCLDGPQHLFFAAGNGDSATLCLWCQSGLCAGIAHICLLTPDLCRAIGGADLYLCDAHHLPTNQAYWRSHRCIAGPGVTALDTHPFCARRDGALWLLVGAPLSRQSHK